MIAWPLVRLLRNVRERAETVDQLLQPSVEDAEDYVRYMCDLYGFVATIAPPLGASDFASARIHMRAAAIVEELLAWGMAEEDVAELARTANGYGPNVVWTEAEALGWRSSSNARSCRVHVSAARSAKLPESTTKNQTANARRGSSWAVT